MSADQPVKGRVSSPELDAECLSCGENEFEKCPKSKRPCGHHCNCSWVHDHCHFCGVEWGENGVPIYPEETTDALD